MNSTTYIIQAQTLTNIANAIRTKENSSEPIEVSDFATRIESIPISEPVVLSDGIRFVQSSFSQFPNWLQDADWSNLTNIPYMFSQCSSLTSVVVPNLSYSGAYGINISNMFYQCSNLVNVSFSNTVKVGGMNNTFQSCSKLTSVSITGSNTAAISTQLCFSGCTSLVTAPTLTGVVSNYPRGMFYGCTKLENVPIYDSSKFSTMDIMFSNCPALSNESLNNIMQMCINTTSSYNGTKTLKFIGLSSSQATTCQSLSNYQDFVSAGWSTGY